MAEGRVAYHGPADEVLDHFAALGHTCPEHYNPAGVCLRSGCSLAAPACLFQRLPMKLVVWVTPECKMASF